MTIGEVFIGDVRDFAAALAPSSVQAIVTSPPYWGLREYPVPPAAWGGDPACTHRWGAAIPAPWVSAIKGPNGSNGKNGATRNVPRVAGAFCHDCGAWCGRLGNEPTVDLYAAHLVEVFRALRPALADDGTLWLNLGDCYAHRSRGQRQHGSSDGGTRRAMPPVKGSVLSGDLKHKDLVGVPWLVAFALRADGWYLRAENIWHKTNALPESVKDRPTRAHEHVFLLTKRHTYRYDHAAMSEPVALPGRRSGNLARRYAQRGVGGRLNTHVGLAFPYRDESGVRNRRSVWAVPTARFPGSHTAHFPPDLVRPCILAGVPRGGVVCDPFLGTGTTAQVAVEEGRRWVGCDLDPQARAWVHQRTDGVAIRLARVEPSQLEQNSEVGQ